MTVAVSCNLSDGVILGVDSAVTLPGMGGIIKVYENAEKLFQLGEKPIGVAIYGLGAIGARTIGSYIREFEVKDPDGLLESPTYTVDGVVESLRNFFIQAYDDAITPIVEAQIGQKITELPPEQLQQLPTLGVIVAGFSSESYLSEVWVLSIPQHRAVNSAQQFRQQGSFGTNWFATAEPIGRYFKGYDHALMENLFQHIEVTKGFTFTEEEINEIGNNLLSPYDYHVPYEAMPMEEGIAQVKFLVEMVINHHRFVVGAPVVGGKARLGMVTYRGSKFELLNGKQPIGG